MHRRTFLIGSAGALSMPLWTILSACSNRASTVARLKIGHADNVSTSKHLAFERLRDILKHQKNANFDVTIFPGGELGSERELIEQTQIGSVQVTSISNGTLVPFAGNFSLLDIPFQFESYAHARRVLLGRMGQQLLDSLSGTKLVGLGFWVQGYRQLTTGKVPVRSLDDLRGLKIRTMQAPMQVLAFQAMGAVPVPMAWSQVYSALQQGVIDGQENPVSVVYTEQLYRVQKYVTLTAHLLDPMPVIANRDWFNQLSDSQRRSLLAAFTTATDYQWSLAERGEAEYRNILEHTTKIQFIGLSAAERQRFQNQAQPAVMAKIESRLGADVLKRWMSSVQNA